MNQDKLWEPSRRIELQYARALRNLARTLIKITKGKSPSEIIDTLEEYAKSRAFIGIILRLRQKAAAV